MALQEFAGKFPDAMFPSEEALYVWKRRDQAHFGATISTTTDPYVFSFGTVGTPAANVVVGSIWSGLTLEVLDPDPPAGNSSPVWHTYMIREVWADEVLAGVYHISVERPIHPAVTNADFRIRQTFIRLPSDTVDIVTITRQSAAVGPIQVVTEGTMNEMVARTKVSGFGTVSMLMRGSFHQEDAPTWTPEVDLLEETAWVGKEPPGKFQYCFTYGFGVKLAEYNLPGNFKSVLWESGPSPDSATVLVPSSGNSCVQLKLPNVAWMLNFDPSPTALRNGHSGVKKLVYRRRYSVSGSGASYKVNRESEGVYQLIAILDDTTTTWTDNGSVVPDAKTRLPQCHGYYNYDLALDSFEDARYDVRLRRPPRNLETDQDVVPIPSAAEAAFLALVTYHVAQGVGQAQTKGAEALARFESLEKSVRALSQPPVKVITPQGFTAKPTDGLTPFGTKPVWYNLNLR